MIFPTRSRHLYIEEISASLSDRSTQILPPLGRIFHRQIDSTLSWQIPPRWNRKSFVLSFNSFNSFWRWWACWADATSDKFSFYSFKLQMQNWLVSFHIFRGNHQPEKDSDQNLHFHSCHRRLPLWWRELRKFCVAKTALLRSEKRVSFSIKPMYRMVWHIYTRGIMVIKWDIWWDMGKHDNNNNNDNNNDSNNSNNDSYNDNI